MSDGHLTPETLVELAVESDLDVLSITDHDSVAGVPQARAKALELGCYFVDGVELETSVQDETGTHHSLHLLGYGIDPRNPRLLDLLREIRRSHRRRTRKILAKLKSLGIAIPFKKVLQISTGESIGRAHIAQTMKNLGFVETLEEAFVEYIGNRGPAYVPYQTPPPIELIHRIHGAGGLAVWAHPHYCQWEGVLERLVAAGLDGIECYYSKFSPEVEDRYRRLARDRDLFVTGGSDFHGTLEEDFRLGEFWYEISELPVDLSVGPGDLALSDLDNMHPR